MQDYQSFQTWINEPDQSSYKPSVNSGNNYDDFYATMSAKYNENITQDDTDACGTYEYFVQDDCGSYFVHPDASQSEINRANVNCQSKSIIFTSFLEILFLQY